MSANGQTRQARYIRNRAARTAAGNSARRRPWSISDARVALDVSLTVPEAALRVGRTASAVESLRRRWRLGRLPDALSAQLPEPPAVAHPDPLPTNRRDPR